MAPGLLVSTAEAAMEQPWSVILRSGVLVATAGLVAAAADNRVFGVALVTDEEAMPILLGMIGLGGLAAAIAIPSPAPRRRSGDE